MALMGIYGSREGRQIEMPADLSGAPGLGASCGGVSRMFCQWWSVIVWLLILLPCPVALAETDLLSLSGQATATRTDIAPPDDVVLENAIQSIPSAGGSANANVTEASSSISVSSTKTGNSVSVIVSGSANAHCGPGQPYIHRDGIYSTSFRFRSRRPIELRFNGSISFNHATTDGGHRDGGAFFQIFPDGSSNPFWFNHYVTYYTASTEAFSEALTLAAGAYTVNVYGRAWATNSALGTGSTNVTSTANLTFELDFQSEPPVVFLHGVAGSDLKIGFYKMWPSLASGDIAMLPPVSGSPTAEAVDVTRDFAGMPFYSPFINFMVNTLGHVEYDLAGNRSRLTSNHMQSLTGADKPSFFVFPYDWRRSNSTHTDTLHQYLTNISTLHGGQPVDIVAHSMGGLVTRRYLLDHGTSKVGRVVTVGSPLLGAVKPIYLMKTGNFFDIGLVDWLNGGTMRSALAALQGVHELLPAPLFLQNWPDSVFREMGVDYNRNGIAIEPYTGAEMFASLDRQVAPLTPPSATNSNFHNYLGGKQGDWSGDTNPPRFLHIVGIKPTNDTIIRVDVEPNVTTVAGVSIQHGYKYVPRFGEGDGTVPTLSSQRKPQYLAPNAVVRVFRGAQTEHTELMHNPGVHAAITDFLAGGDGLSAAAAPAALAQAAKPESQSYLPGHATPAAAPPESGPLAEALDAPSLTWETDGDAIWGPQTTVTHDGADAAACGPIPTPFGDASLRTTVNGPGLLSYWAKVLSGPDNYLEFSAGGSSLGVADMSGDTGWVRKEVLIGAGPITIEWTFVDGTQGTGGTAPEAWIDEVSFAPHPHLEVWVGTSEEPLERHVFEGDAPYAIGPVNLNDTATILVTLKNIGGAPLSGVAAALAGAEAADFQIQGTVNPVIAAGGSQEITITFTPRAARGRRAGVRSAQVNLSPAGVSGGPFSVPVEGGVASGRREVFLVGAGYVPLSDGSGNSNTLLSEIAATKVPNVLAMYGGDEDYVDLFFPADLELQVDTAEVDDELDVFVVEYDSAGDSFFSQRYRFVPGSREWRFTFPPNADPELRVDLNGNGSVEDDAVQPPQISGNGDVTRPQITLLLQNTDGLTRAVLSATDNEPGATVHLTLDDGPVQPYAGPIDFQPGGNARLKAFARDAMGQTSGLIETVVAPVMSIGAAGGNQVVLNWPDADGWLLEEASSPSGPWTLSLADTSSSGGIKSATMPTAGAARFFRVRSEPVQK